MAITHKLSLTELKTVVAQYVTANKIAVDSFNVTRDNIVGLLDKVGKIFNIETNIVDKLAVFDGDNLPYGKTIEEWASDLMLPTDFTGDDDGNEALKRNNLTYRPVSYSYTLGRKKFALSVPNDNIERAVNNQGEFSNIVNDMVKKMYDSERAYKYACKRQALGDLIAKCLTAQGSTTLFGNTTHFAVNTFLKESSASDVRGVVVKDIPASSNKSWAQRVADGSIVPINLVDVIAIPTDEASGSAFIKKIMDDVETASDMSEGHSLNGNTLGASNGLALIIKQGVMSSLKVDTLAGAINKGELDYGVDTIVVKDFGDDTQAFSILVDKRALKLYEGYRAVRENLNGAGDFLNMFLHIEYTAHISKNTFVKVYKGA